MTGMFADCFIAAVAVALSVIGVDAACDQTILSQPVDQAIRANPLPPAWPPFYYVFRSNGNDFCIETRVNNTGTGKMDLFTSPQNIANIFKGAPAGRIVNYQVDRSQSVLTFVLFNDKGDSKSCTWQARDNFVCGDNLNAVAAPTSRAHSMWFNSAGNAMINWSTITNLGFLAVKWPTDPAAKLVQITPATGPAVAFADITGLLQVGDVTLMVFGVDVKGAAVSGLLQITTTGPTKAYGLMWLNAPAVGKGPLV